MMSNCCLVLSIMKRKGFVYFKACCCMFLSLVHQRTKIIEVWDCMNCLCILPLSTSFTTLLLSVYEVEADEMGHLSPYCPVLSGSIVGENLTASELRLLQNCWLNPNGASEHQRPPTSSCDWVCFCRINFKSNNQTEISCTERVCMDVCACVSFFFFFFTWPSSFAFISDPIDLPSDPSLAAQLHHSTARTALAWPPTLYVLVRVVECRRLWAP